jgi:hypothetical protein
MTCGSVQVGRHGGQGYANREGYEHLVGRHRRQADKIYSTLCMTDLKRNWNVSSAEVLSNVSNTKLGREVVRGTISLRYFTDDLIWRQQSVSMTYPIFPANLLGKFGFLT